MPEVQENENMERERNDSELYNNRMINSMESSVTTNVFEFENNEFGEYLSHNDDKGLNVIELNEALVANSKPMEYSRDEI
jgi:hypothetical protein